MRISATPNRIGSEPGQMTSSARVTIRDVAQHAGVSQPTASLVLGRHPRARVAPATRERVLAAAAELGYRPNVVAQSLARGRSFALGVIVPDLRNPFFADVVAGAERVASAAGYALLLCGDGERPVETHLETLLRRQIDGVILDAANAASLDRQALAGVNVVLVDEPSHHWPGVASDASGAGRAAAEHLLALGHRRLAFVGPSVDLHGFRMRERGFVQALRAAGVPLPSRWLRRAPATAAGGRDAMRALLADRPRPTAVFCANDLLAIGALKAAAEGGVRVPTELSLVGCDDIELARLVTPELTTITVPARELGARAARLLLQQLAGELPRVSAAPLPVKLVRRGTTAAAPSDLAIDERGTPTPRTRGGGR
jgi:DNA-binding LacI/PurR family transcriptional regulator